MAHQFGFKYGESSLAALLAFAALLSTGAQAATKVACVGNSITYGYMLNGATTYPQHLQKIMGDAYQVENFGNSGKMFHKASQESYWTQTTFADAYNFAPDIVVIELGTNDSKYFFSGSEDNYNYYYYEYKNYTRDALIQEMAKDYEALIDTFAHQPQNPTIYATLQPYAENIGWFITDSVIVNTINLIINVVAKKKDVKIIDLHASFNKPEWLQADNVHPNETGAEELAKIIADAIQKKEQDSSETTPSTSSSESSEIAESSSSFESVISDSSDASSSSLAEASSSSAEAKANSSTTVSVRIASRQENIRIQGSILYIDNYVGMISLFDVNGNLILKQKSNGSAVISTKQSGSFIVKTENAIKKVQLRLQSKAQQETFKKHKKSIAIFRHGSFVICVLTRTTSQRKFY